MDLIGMAVLGAGYWGPNLIRNIRATEDADLRWICDLDLARAERANGPRSTTRVTGTLEDVLEDPDVRAVCIATPAATHVEVGLACIESGKHVMIEKPLALSSGDASKLIAAAHDAGVVLMCDHTYCYTPAVRHIRSLVQDGTARRPPILRLGPDQPRSRADRCRRLLGPGSARPVDPRLHPARGVRVEAVAAQGADPIVGRSRMPRLPDHPALIGRDRPRPRELAQSDEDPNDAHRGIGAHRRLGRSSPDAEGQHVRQRRAAQRWLEARRDKIVSYRLGDMVAPALPEEEALQVALREFVTSIDEGRAPRPMGTPGSG